VGVSAPLFFEFLLRKEQIGKSRDAKCTFIIFGVQTVSSHTCFMQCEYAVAGRSSQSTVHGMFLRSTRRHPERIALELQYGTQARFTYAQVRLMALSAAKSLTGLGVGPGWYTHAHKNTQMNMCLHMHT